LSTIKPPQIEPAIKTLMMPCDTNIEGTIFGGFILSLMDKAAYIEAMRQAQNRYVTVCFKEVQFHKPIHVGDIVSIYANTTKIGNTSITIHLTVFSQRRDNTYEQIKVTEGEIVFVAINEKGEKVNIYE